MKNYYYLIIVLFLTILYPKAYSNDRYIAFIDVDKIVYESNIGVIEIGNIQSRFKKQYETFKIKEDSLVAQKKEILTKKNILSNDETDKLINNFNIEFQKFNQEKNNFDKNINDEKIEKINKLLKELNSILTNYAEENSIDLIIKKKDIIIGKTSLDITEDIMEIFNKEVKKLN